MDNLIAKRVKNTIVLCDCNDLNCANSFQNRSLKNSISQYKNHSDTVNSLTKLFHNQGEFRHLFLTCFAVIISSFCLFFCFFCFIVRHCYFLWAFNRNFVNVDNLVPFFFTDIFILIAFVLFYVPKHLEQPISISQSGHKNCSFLFFCGYSFL